MQFTLSWGTGDELAGSTVVWSLDIGKIEIHPH
jgi:hypothetical protein